MMTSNYTRSQAVLGRYYAKVGDLDVASHHYSQSLEAMNEEGDILAMVDITILLGEVLQDSGKLTKQWSILERH